MWVDSAPPPHHRLEPLVLLKDKCPIHIPTHNHMIVGFKQSKLTQITVQHLDKAPINLYTEGSSVFVNQSSCSLTSKPSQKTGLEDEIPCFDWFDPKVSSSKPVSITSLIYRGNPKVETVYGHGLWSVSGQWNGKTADNSPEKYI